MIWKQNMDRQIVNAWLVYYFKTCVFNNVKTYP